MIATIKLEKKHFPVLLDELESIISPLYGGTFIDCTFGSGVIKDIKDNSKVMGYPAKDLKKFVKENK